MLYNLSREYGDYMKNNKGFVLTETLVVTVFLVTISTFIYVSIMPLIGTYEDLINRDKDIDIVYKLYNIRKLMYKDKENMSNKLKNKSNMVLRCSDFTEVEYCNELVHQMEIEEFRLVYINDINDENLNAIRDSVLENIRENPDDIVDTNIGTEMYNYIKEYQNSEGKYLILMDLNPNKHTLAHLLYAGS